MDLQNHLNEYGLHQDLSMEDGLEYEYQQEYEEELNFQYMQRTSSEVNSHRQAKRGDIIKKFWQDITQIQIKTCLPRNWCFMLFQRCQWRMQIIDSLLVQKSSYRNLINYRENLNIKQRSNQLCATCLTEPVSLKNTCGHMFCETCWRLNLQASLTNQSKVVPKCPGYQCFHKMNYLLIEDILIKQGQRKELKEKFQKILSVSYSKSNPQVKVCPNFQCSAQFIIDIATKEPIVCSCGTYFCAICGKHYHHPIQCHQMKNWEKIVKAKQKEWIKILFFKHCPKCDTPIQKNQGCNHMTCKCKYEFCWVCLKDWKTHKKCPGIQQHQKSQQQFQKLLKNHKQSQQKYQEVSDQVERLQAIQRRMQGIQMGQIKTAIYQLGQIRPSSLLFFSDISKLASYCLQFCRDCMIYKFFTPQEQYLPIYEVQKKAAYEMLNQIDDFVIKVQKHISCIQKYQNLGLNSKDNLQSLEQYIEKIKSNKQELQICMAPENTMKVRNLISRLSQYMQKIISHSWR